MPEAPASVRAASAASAQSDFLRELIAARLLVPSGVAGVVGRGDLFERIVEAVDAYVTRIGATDRAERFRFPPVMPRAQYEHTDHLRAFPQLIGCVHCFSGGDAEHQALIRAVEGGQDWSGAFVAGALVLTPAACYPVYPMARGALPPGGRTVDVQSYCHRHEPSDDPARMQLFRMHEFVRLGAPEEAKAFRDRWAEQARAALLALGLAARLEVAHDPFFGRAGRILAANQTEQELKFEVVVPITSATSPTACASANCHLDHFTTPFGITLHDGGVAHSACVGFGLERCALALLRTHGLAVSDWPAPVRALLQL